MSLDPKITKDGQGVYWLNWTPDPTAEGYAFTTPSGASRTFNPTQSKAKLGKHTEPVVATVAALDVSKRQAETATYPATVPPPPPPPPPVVLGYDLPPPNIDSPGGRVDVGSFAQLKAAVEGGAPNGSTIWATSDIGGGGVQWNVNRIATAAAPITIRCAPGIKFKDFSQWYVADSAYLNFRDGEYEGFSDVAIKPTAFAHHIDIADNHIHHIGRQALLVTSAATHVQVRRNYIHDGGMDTNYDQLIYFGYTGGYGCTILANLVVNPWAYGIQAYPKVPNLIVAGNTTDGGQRHTDDRGGTVLGSEGTPTTFDAKIVGQIGTYAPNNGVIRINAPIGPCYAYDCIGFGNGDGDYEPEANMTYENCITADPLYVNRTAGDYRLRPGSPAIGHVKPARYGLLPPYYRDKSPRLAGVAGSERQA